jgi:predicted ArsR family transcriptional regulator
MTTLQQQARALGDPTRHAIFRHVAEAGRAVGIAELTEQFGFNHNAIRQHLAKLLAAGLVVEDRVASSGPGRPRLVYEIDPAAAGQWGTTGPYERLSRLLVEIIHTGRGPVEVGRRAADQFRVPSPSGDVVADITAAMARQGFEPEVRAIRGGAEIVLHNCPFETSAVGDRATVCSLHLGIAQGLAEGTHVAVDELVANDPHRADCRLRLRVTAEDREPPTGAGKLSLRGTVAST